MTVNQNCTIMDCYHIGQNHKQALCVSFGIAFFYYSKRLKVME
ncbi:hypothetical protein C1A50_1437 [Paenibacillus polymyxa]|nr:hypothetical protein C1A50_1437 [Paenibacillus polymyxa]